MDWKKIAITTAAAFTLTTSPVEANKDVILNHLESLPTDKHRRQARYFVTDHLVDSGYPSDLLDTYDHLLKFLVNSLHWESRMFDVIKIENSDSIFYFDMSVYGDDGYPWASSWVVKWERCIDDVYPQTEHYVHQFADIIELTSSDVPVIEADWFLVNASTGELYYDLLFPKVYTIKDLEDDLPIKYGTFKVAGLTKSFVAKNRRIITRQQLHVQDTLRGYKLPRKLHNGWDGYYYKSFDYEEGIPTDDLIDNLVTDLDFGPFNGGEMIFTLPNGLQGYFVVNAKGERVTEAPLNIAEDKSAHLGDTVIRNAASCMSCHRTGLNTFIDEARVEAIKVPTKPLEDMTPTKKYDPNKQKFFSGDWLNEFVYDDNLDYLSVIHKVGGAYGTETQPYKIGDVYREYNEPGPMAAPRKPQRKIITMWGKLK